VTLGVNWCWAAANALPHITGGADGLGVIMTPLLGSLS
jgi:hypothetical protein